MKPNRRETISLLAGAAPVALGVLSASTANPVSANDAKPAAATDRHKSQSIETRIGRLEFTHEQPMEWFLPDRLRWR